MSPRIADRYDLPGPLRNAVAATLDAYDNPDDAPEQSELVAATTRIHTKFGTDISDIGRDGPLAYDGDLLVYAIPRVEWNNLCADMAIYANTRSWAQRIQCHAAHRIAARDPYVPRDRVRPHYESAEQRAVVVEHP